MRTVFAPKCKSPSPRFLHTRYDENGNLDRYTDRDGRVTVYVYDALNRMTDEQWLDGSENIVRDLHFDYDNADLLTGARIITIRTISLLRFRSITTSPTTTTMTWNPRRGSPG